VARTTKQSPEIGEQHAVRDEARRPVRDRRGDACVGGNSVFQNELLAALGNFITYKISPRERFVLPFSLNHCTLGTGRLLTN